MRRWACVPMMTLCLLLAACGGTGGETEGAAEARMPYRNMAGCVMEAEVSCTQDGAVWEATLRCDYVPEGETTVEVLSPETIAGVKAVLSDGEAALEYEDQCLNAGTLSSQDISPMACLPQLMSALRDGWLLEENQEDWGETPCVRLTVDQTGSAGRQDPLHPVAAAGGQRPPPGGDRRGRGNHFDGGLYELFLL